MSSSSKDKLRQRVLKYVLSEMEKRGIPNKDVQYKENQEHKEVQVEFSKIVDASVYSRKPDGEITADVENLPDVPFYETQPDDSNKCFARLIAFELQRVPLDQRSNLYIEIIDMVRRARGGDLDFELRDMSQWIGRMPNKKTKDDRAAQQRLCQKRRYNNIKNDPELLKIEKEKRKIRYIKRKAEKKQVSIGEKSSRAQREQRKKWKENSRRYRQRKKEEKGTIDLESVQIIEAEIDENQGEKAAVAEDLFDVAVQIKNIKVKERKKRKCLLRIINMLKKKNEAKRKRIIRLEKRLEKSQTELSELKSKESPTQIDETVSPITPAASSRTSNIIQKVLDFYVDDSNSTIKAGKKEYITRNKVRKQKRVLTAPLTHLYKRCIAETGINVSYSFFCKLRPFFVVFPTSNMRETCQCTIHANMELLIQGLNKASIIEQKNSHEIIQTFCCDPRNVACLLKNCEQCKDKAFTYKSGISDDTVVTFFQWNNTNKKINTKDGDKTIKKVVEKQKITLGFEEATQKFESMLVDFFKHTAKIVHQYNTIKNKKENLNICEAIIHIDYSENFSLKYGSETQSFTISRSRKQVTLHTAVLYTHDFQTGEVTPTSMCTVSECLRHDAPAVWAHILPLIEKAIKLNPFLDTIHFMSDSPTSQYRNKCVFFFISQLKNDFEQLKTITWNYSEVGHGKGAPDGVGAVIKRTVDRMVNFGEDVGTFQQFCEVLDKNIDKVSIQLVQEEVVLEREKLIPSNLKPFRGTFDTYQALWTDQSSNQVTMRKMCCFECEAFDICKHNKHIGFYDIEISHVIDKNNKSSDASAAESVVSLSSIKSTSKKRKIQGALCDVTNKNPRPSTSKASNYADQFSTFIESE